MHETASFLGTNPVHYIRLLLSKILIFIKVIIFEFFLAVNHPYFKVIILVVS